MGAVGVLQGRRVHARDPEVERTDDLGDFVAGDGLERAADLDAAGELGVLADGLDDAVAHEQQREGEPFEPGLVPEVAELFDADGAEVLGLVDADDEAAFLSFQLSEHLVADVAERARDPPAEDFPGDVVHRLFRRRAVDDGDDDAPVVAAVAVVEQRGGLAGADLSVPDGVGCPGSP